MITIYTTYSWCPAPFHSTAERPSIVFQISTSWPKSSSVSERRQFSQHSFHCCPYDFIWVEVWWHRRPRQHLNNANSNSSLSSPDAIFLFTLVSPTSNLTVLKGLALKYSTLSVSVCASVNFGRQEQYLSFRLFCCLLLKKGFVHKNSAHIGCLCREVGLTPAWMWPSKRMHYSKVDKTSSTISYKLHQHKNSNIQDHESNFEVQNQSHWKHH